MTRYLSSAQVSVIVIFLDGYLPVMKFGCFYRFQVRARQHGGLLAVCGLVWIDSLWLKANLWSPTFFVLFFFFFFGGYNIKVLCVNIQRATFLAFPDLTSFNSLFANSLVHE